jgi:hypothetical protein
MGCRTGPILLLLLRMLVTARGVAHACLPNRSFLKYLSPSAHRLLRSRDEFTFSCQLASNNSAHSPANSAIAYINTQMDPDAPPNTVEQNDKVTGFLTLPRERHAKRKAEEAQSMFSALPFRCVTIDMFDSIDGTGAGQTHRLDGQESSCNPIHR